MSKQVKIVTLDALGYRSLIPQTSPQRDYASNIAALCERRPEYHYEYNRSGKEYWLRRIERRKGCNIIPMARCLARFGKDQWIDKKDMRWLDDYSRSSYAEYNRRKGIGSTIEDCIKLMKHLCAEKEPHIAFTNFAKGIGFAQYSDLEAILRQAFDIYFCSYPDGIVTCYMLDDRFAKLFGFQRASYAFSNFKPEEFDKRPGSRKFAALRDWHYIDHIHIIPLLLDLADYFFYPNISGFHADNIGLVLHFSLAKPYIYTPGVWPPTWMDIPLAHASFAGEQIPWTVLLGEQSATEKASYRRYCYKDIPDLPGRIAMVDWVINRASILWYELTDICNYLDEDNIIDPIYCFEHSLTIDRLFRIIILASINSIPNVAKGLTFEVADLLETLAEMHLPNGISKDMVFKMLFNPIDAPGYICKCISDMPKDIHKYLVSTIAAIYSDIEKSVFESIYIPGLIKGNGVMVKDRKLENMVEEKYGQFIGNVMRALRNTHHGYITKRDPANRPSRYLSITTGNIADSLSALPSYWALACLGDPSGFIGLPMLPIGKFEI